MKSGQTSERKHAAADGKPNSGKIPNQYPNMKPKSHWSIWYHLLLLDLNESDDDTR